MNSRSETTGPHPGFLPFARPLRQGGRILAGEDAQTEIPISDASAPPSLPDLDSAAKYAPTPCGSSSRRTARTRVRLPLPMQRRRLHPYPITFDGKGSLPGEKKSSRDGRPPPGLRYSGGQVFRACPPEKHLAPHSETTVSFPSFRLAAVGMPRRTGEPPLHIPLRMPIFASSNLEL